MGFIGAALVLCFARGPWQKGWLGWSEGWGLRRRDLTPQGRDEEKVDGLAASGNAGQDQATSEVEKVVDERAARVVREDERGRITGEIHKN